MCHIKGNESVILNYISIIISDNFVEICIIWNTTSSQKKVSVKKLVLHWVAFADIKSKLWGKVTTVRYKEAVYLLFFHFFFSFLEYYIILYYLKLGPLCKKFLFKQTKNKHLFKKFTKGLNFHWSKTLENGGEMSLWNKGFSLILVGHN